LNNQSSQKPSHIAIASGFRLLLSRIPTAKNKFHHLLTEMGHDGDHPFREKTLWGPAIDRFTERSDAQPNCEDQVRRTVEDSQIVRNVKLAAQMARPPISFGGSTRTN
jgi:hypothetical protein